jgi:hypothetical protein
MKVAYISFDFYPDPVNGTETYAYMLCSLSHSILEAEAGMLWCMMLLLAVSAIE